MRSVSVGVFFVGILGSLLGGAGAGAAGSETELPKAAAQAMQSIAPQRIAAHVRFLASDGLEGRGTGARGGDIAADYIATQFALDGLRPGGDHGSYLQNVRFTGITTVPEQTRLSLQPEHGEALPLRYADDTVVSDETGATASDLDAPIVFVGFGINSPENHWNDYAGTDVRGKVVLLFVNEPESDDVHFFNGKALTYAGRWIYKYEEAARQGAAGVLIIHRTDLASYPWSVVRSSWTGEDVQLADDQAPKLKAAAWIQLDIARKLFAASGLDLDAMYAAANHQGFKPVALPVRYQAHIASNVRHFESHNVLGFLPGADGIQDLAKAQHVVVYSAHYDHLGIVAGGKAADGSATDTIYNGAVDNGTGCGILLELARAYASSAVKPAHGILFASVTAEEKGLLGSRYLGEHLPLPAGQVALDLNYDAILPIGDPQATTVSGAERTTFYPTLTHYAQQFGLQIAADPTPGAGHYYRSDHFSMARVGVPAFSIGQGVSFAGHTPEWGKAQEEDYVSHRYHQPSDEYRDDMDFTGNAKLARFGFALGWSASAQPQAIDWQSGDEFAAVRAASLAAPKPTSH